VTKRRHQATALAPRWPKMQEQTGSLKRPLECGCVFLVCECVVVMRAPKLNVFLDMENFIDFKRVHEG